MEEQREEVQQQKERNEGVAKWTVGWKNLSPDQEPGGLWAPAGSLDTSGSISQATWPCLRVLCHGAGGNVRGRQSWANRWVLLIFQTKGLLPSADPRM